MEIKDIIHNTTLGSAELCLEINKFLLSNKNISLENIEENVVILKSELQVFSTIENYLSNIEKFIDNNDIKGLISYLDYYQVVTHSQFAEIYNKGKKNFQKLNKIITISNSRTVKEVLNFWNEDNDSIEVYILRSLPGGEGEICYNELIRQNIKVHIIEDFEAVLYINHCDGCIVGTDSILANGNIINKIGSFNLAILSNYFNKPFYVLADRTKYSNLSKFNKKSFNERAQLFEEINSNLISDIITD